MAFPVEKGKEKAVEKLEVEDEGNRLQRIQNVLEALSRSSSRAQPKPLNSVSLPPFDFGDRSTYAIEPPTELLARVQAFLPQLEASNAVLTQKLQMDPKSVDIENVHEDEEQYIEMNLGLGIFEDRTSKSRNSDCDSSSDESDSDSSDSSSGSSSDDLTDSTFSKSGEFAQREERLMNPLPKRSRRRPIVLPLGGGLQASL